MILYVENIYLTQVFKFSKYYTVFVVYFFKTKMDFCSEANMHDNRKPQVMLILPMKCFFD